MKHHNQLRLARMANANTFSGSASALTLAKRITRITGSPDAENIVSTVYSRSSGKAVWECRECGQEYIDPDQAAACCAEDHDDDDEPTTPIPWNNEAAHFADGW